MKNLPYYLRRRHVLDLLSGVDGRQLQKMVQAGTLQTVTLHPRGRAFFLRDEVLRLVTAGASRDEDNN